jgi:hypothetical protein
MNGIGAIESVQVDAAGARATYYLKEFHSFQWKTTYNATAMHFRRVEKLSRGLQRRIYYARCVKKAPFGILPFLAFPRRWQQLMNWCMRLELPDGDLKISAGPGRVGGHITLQNLYHAQYYSIYITVRKVLIWNDMFGRSRSSVCKNGRSCSLFRKKNWPSMAYTTGKPQICREPDTTGQGRNPVGKGFAVNGSRQNPHGKQFLAESH